MSNNNTGASSQASLDYTGNVRYWENLWKQNQIDFHCDVINPTLTSNIQKLTDGLTNKRFFVPLCGKSLDIPYLYKQGHRVFGVEAVPKGIEDLSSENGLGLKYNPENCTYSNEDGRIVIYCGDIFACPFEQFGPFDCVWDRGSFIALEYQFRPAYKEMMKRSLRVQDYGRNERYHNFKYLLETYDYNREKFGGPPRAVDGKDMNAFFADWTHLDMLSQVLDESDIGVVYQTVYMLTPKQAV